MINYAGIEMPPMTDEEQRLVREYIASSHEDDKCSIYGDDGELQCNNIERHGRCLDFMREPIKDLLENIQNTRLKEVIEAMSKASKEVVL
jgi:hypothetical protein